MYLKKGNGEFAGSKKRGSWVRKIGVSAILAGVLGGGVWAGEVWLPEQIATLKGKELHYQAPRAEAAEIITLDTIETMKRDVLDRLAKCENPHNKPIVFDTNGVASVGQYQWQPHSFQHYWQKKTGVKLTEKEAVVFALDDVKARELAAYVIFETDRGSEKDWVNCTAWHDLDTLVKFIKAHD